MLIFDRNQTIIIEDGFRKTKRKSQADRRLSRLTTKYCGNQSDKNVWFLLKTSITERTGFVNVKGAIFVNINNKNAVREGCVFC